MMTVTFVFMINNQKKSEVSRRGANSSFLLSVPLFQSHIKGAHIAGTFCVRPLSIPSTGLVSISAGCQGECTIFPEEGFLMPSGGRCGNGGGAYTRWEVVHTGGGRCCILEEGGRYACGGGAGSV